MSSKVVDEVVVVAMLFGGISGMEEGELLLVVSADGGGVGGEDEAKAGPAAEEGLGG